MLEILFHWPSIVRRLQSTVLGDVLDTLAADLRTRGNTDRTIKDYLRAIGHFAHWLGKRDVSVAALSEETVDEFCYEHLPRCRCTVPTRTSRSHVRAALGHLLSMLRKTGKIAPKATPTPGPIDKLVEAFLAHSRQCRGVGVLTCYQQGAYVRQFLVARFGAGPIDLPAITARDVKDFVVRRAEQGHLRTAKLAGTGLRCFLRFLAFQQLCDPLLVQAVPSVVHRFRRISPTLTEEQLRRLLDWFDRTTAIGRRDHAMALCMASLGLRVGEVVQLRLEEVDWRVGTLCVSAGKRRRPAVLPLPSGLGEALGEYIRVARPATTQRRIFVTHAVPVGRALSAHGAAAAIRRAWEHVDPNGATRGTHVIRHTVATRMVCEGASLKEVADVLRHHDLDTTVVYAKVDLPKLKKVALPWPEVH